MRDDNNLTLRVPDKLAGLLGTNGFNANCWGATRTFFEREYPLDWIDSEEMESWLEESTILCEGLHIYDILVMRHHSGQLIHTAVCIGYQHGDAVFFQKRGSNEFEICGLNDIRKVYGRATKFGAAIEEIREYRRT